MTFLPVIKCRGNLNWRMVSWCFVYTVQVSFESAVLFLRYQTGYSSSTRERLKADKYQENNIVLKQIFEI